MATFSLKPASDGADNIEGTEASDLAVAVNANLNAGDIVDLKGGSDIVRSAVDASLLANVAGRHDFSGFTFLGVETFEIINDSTLVPGIRYDMSSSPGIQTFRITNSSATTTIDQIPNLAVFELDNYTNAGFANVNIGFRSSVLSGSNDTITVNVSDTDLQKLDIGTANPIDPLDPNNVGIETLRLNVLSGSSVIQDIDSGANRIEFTGSGDIAVVARLDDTATTVTSDGSGNRTLSLGNNAGVTYLGNIGVNNITGGTGNDTIITADGDDIVDGRGGNDTIIAGGGNNTVRTGAGTNSVTTFSGNDVIFAQGLNDVIDSGGGQDVIDITGTAFGTRTTINAGNGSDRIDAGDRFDASNTANGDVVNMGGGFDIVEVSNGLSDAQFFQASNLEALAVTAGASTSLGARAEMAGIDIVYFASGNADDTLLAGTFTQDLAVSNGQEYGGRGLGGNDTVVTGSGADAFLWRGNNALTDADNLDAGAQNTAASGAVVDGLYLAGDTTITAASGIRGFEYIALETTRNSIFASLVGDTGAQYNITLSNAQAPTSGRLFINGSSLQADTDGAGMLVGETATISTVAVTTFGTDILTGNGNDVINSGAMADTIVTAGGDDIVNAGGGNDVIDTGFGDDVVNLQSGNNRLTDESGNNTITLGTGNDTLLLGNGNDTVVGGANLDALDSIPGFGAGTDVLRVFGRDYSDADFTGVGGGLETLELGSRVGDVGAAAGDEVFSFTLGAQVAKTNVLTVVANGAGASTIDASTITRGLTFDLSAGGNDVLLATQGDDLIIAGTGIQSVTGGQGNNTLRVSDSQLTLADTFIGGTDTDTIELDNTNGGVTASVNLETVRSVENYVLRANGDRGPGVDTDNNSVFFGSNGSVTSVNTQTIINVDFSKLTDINDAAGVFISNTVGDADYVFNITGSSTQTTVRKNNVGVNNDINFTGGSGVDILEINGSDLGSTTVFNGNGGQDVVRLINGVVTDDSYVSVRGVEVLESLGVTVRATLGAQAALSGLQLVRGSTGGDAVIIDAAFTNALRVELGGGFEFVNGSASTAALTVADLDTRLTTNDNLTGGSSANDIIEVTANNGDANLNNTSGFETISVIGDFNTQTSTGSTVIVDTTAGQVSGGIQTITTSGFGTTDAFRLGGDAATARLFVNSQDGNDVIRTGSGADQIGAGNGDNQVASGAGNDVITTGIGSDLINAGDGDDLVNAGGGSDIVNGGDGNDILNGEGGADRIRGGLGGDTIDGGEGNDQIEGGAGVDTLTGGTGADIFFYRNVSDSAGSNGRDTIKDFASGVDKIDVSDLLGTSSTVMPGQPTGIAWQGNQANFTDAQGAVNANDGIIDVVFQADFGILWFDTNDDGALNANDLQIVLQGTPSITGADVGAGAVGVVVPFTAGDTGMAVTPYDTFDASFVAVSVVP